jgi:cysteine desulfurase / selenocysteine lyase
MTTLDVSAARQFAMLRQEQFPVAERYVYLNHAALGPLPRRTADAVAAVAADFRDRGMLAERAWLPAVTRARELTARLLHVAPEEIAFTKNTSQGLNIVAAGVPWKPGDVIVTVRGEFPANVYPWLALQQAGVQVRFVQPRQGRILLSDLNQALNGAKMLAISWVQYSNGFRIDLAALSELCRRRGVLLCLDAIQGVGALPLDLRATPVDFCAFGGHKWMLAPQGIGVLYISSRMRELLGPMNTGWMGVAWKNYTAFDYESPLIEGAPRYEEGTRSLAGIAGLEQSLSLLLEIGPATIAGRLSSLTEHLVQRLLARGYQMLTPLLPVERSGIVTFAHGQRSAHELWDRLRASRIVAAVREGGVRISPHLYNTIDEMDAVVDTLEGSS